MSEPQKSKILFIRIGHFSGTNDSFLEQIKAKFPAHEVVTFDAVDAFKQHPLYLAWVLIPMVLRYGRSAINMAWLLRTRFATQQMKRWINKIVRSGEYACTIQTQSLFDASTSHVPHFIYTDHTTRANLYYPEQAKYLRINERFLENEDFYAREKEIYHHATYVFTMSTHVKQSLIEHYDCNADKVHVIGAGPNMTLDPHYNPVKDYTKRLILFVGLDWERKGGPELLEAFKIVREAIPDAMLNIVGCSPDIQYPGVQVIGRVPKQQVPDYYVEATVFCMPSKREPFGIVYLEAMYNRLPIVALNMGALPDLIKEGENGYTVEHGDIQQLANVLIELLQDTDKCQQMGAAGYQFLMSNWTWDAVGRNLKQHLQPFIDA